MRPGLSTESRARNSRKTSTRKPTTSTSIAIAFEIGAWGNFGSMCSARNSASTGAAKIRFRSAVKGSCSGMEKVVSCKLSVVSKNQLNSAAQRYDQFVHRFAEDRRHGEKQAAQQAVEAVPGNTEYSIGGKRD